MGWMAERPEWRRECPVPSAGSPGADPPLLACVWLLRRALLGALPPPGGEPMVLPALAAEAGDEGGGADDGVADGVG